MIDRLIHETTSHTYHSSSMTGTHDRADGFSLSS